MAEDKNSTSAEHLKGSVKEALGKLTGDPRVEAEGRRQKKDANTPKAGRSKPTGPERG
ncbi:MULTISPECIES: CsbD family protein [unclassified Methylobacterium]|uniref:CsbD family protein n=1 Tax=unclassified Methylobacterium TaxID=2615210 RepID=UPI001FBC05BB|nr:MULTISPECIES: CsbD family protein [unclassified Methylobacterium]MCJ2017444.1 CsbD family protein [Methylobacterium sp. E-065]